MKKIKSDYVAGVELDISDGGINISVTDSDYGPKLQIYASHFGHKTNQMDLLLHPDALLDLAAMFKKAAEYTYTNEPYCMALGKHFSKCCGGKCKGHSTGEDKS